jgi:hypothetical protein
MDMHIDLDRILNAGEDLNMDVFEQLGFSDLQLQQLADLYVRWSRSRRALKVRLAAALPALESLPSAHTMPPALLREITPVPPPSGSCAWFPASEDMGSAQRTSSSWAVMLVGISPTVTAAAAAAVIQLRRVLEDDGRLFARCRLAILDSPNGLQAEQALACLTHKADGTIFTLDQIRILQVSDIEARVACLCDLALRSLSRALHCTECESAALQLGLVPLEILQAWLIPDYKSLPRSFFADGSYKTPALQDYAARTMTLE